MNMNFRIPNTEIKYKEMNETNQMKEDEEKKKGVKGKQKINIKKNDEIRKDIKRSNSKMSVGKL